MSYDPTGHQLLTPTDPEAPNRVARLREIGIGDRPDPEFDQFARHIATATGAPFGFVNFIDENRQYFAGLWTPQGSPAGDGGNGEPSRIMERDHGFCPHVVVRRLPLVLDDVCDYPRFAGNPVVDEIGIRSYLGAPLIDWTGATLGTICVVDLEPRPWGRPGLEQIKGMAQQLVDRIHQRAGHLA
jgi:GAF domain-containing protein